MSKLAKVIVGGKLWIRKRIAIVSTTVKSLDKRPEHLLSDEKHVHFSGENGYISWPILHNFWPYCPQAIFGQHFISPAQKLNRFVYYDNWLNNLLIFPSCAGITTVHRIQ